MTDNLQPGPELDALVAEKVMGWEYVIDGEGTGWVDKATEQFVTGYNNDDPSQPEIAPPPFSTSIAAAWEVVEKLKSDNRTIDISSATPGWRAIIDECHDWKVEVRAETAPRAICLAAMKASGA